MGRGRTSKRSRIFLAGATATGVLAGLASAGALTRAHAAGGSRQPDLTVTVAADLPVAQPGVAGAWSVVASNVGTAPAAAFIVSFPGTSGRGATGTGWTCITTAPTRSGAARSWCTSAGLAAGETSTITIPFTAPGTAATYSLTATIDSGNAVVESNETNNTATGSYVVPVNGPYDFTVQQVVSGPDPVLPSETVTFTNSVQNIGLYPAFTTVTLTNALPPGFSFVSWTPNYAPFLPPSAVSCTPSGEPTTGVIVTCIGVANSIAGSTPPVTIDIVAQPAATTELVDYIAANVVTVDSDNAFPESNETNNTATGSRRISNMLPDLALQITSPPNPIEPGGVITHDITVTNTGSGNSPVAVVRFGSYAGIWIGGGGNGATCGVLFTTRSGATRGCNVGALAAGASVTFPLQLRASGLVGTTTTSGNVSVSGAREVPAGPDNSATATATVVTPGPVDLTVAIATTPSIPVGQPTLFQVTVTNGGIGLAAATTVNTTLPTGFVLTSGATDVGGVCSATGQVVSCPLDAIAPGRSVSLTINATAPSVAGSFSVVADVDLANVVPESDETNNTAAAAVEVSGVFADLTTAITGSVTAATNAKLAYTITVTNVGSLAAPASTFTLYERGFDRVDSVVAPAGWGCQVSRVKNAGNYVFCTAPILEPGAAGTIQLSLAGSYGRGAWDVTSGVDTGNAIQELSETNNTAWFSTTVS
jgi:uncharacterized repeat protein (TIGR01451 family)